MLYYQKTFFLAVISGVRNVRNRVYLLPGKREGRYEKKQGDQTGENLFHFKSILIVNGVDFKS